MNTARTRFLVAILGLLTAIATAGTASAQSQNVVTSDSNATYHTILSRKNAYQYQLDFTIYMTGSAAQAQVPFIDTTGVLKREMRPVARIDLHSLAENRIRLRVCLDNVCQLLDTARYSFPQRPDTATLLRILVTPQGRRGEPEITGKEEVRLEMESGAVMIQRRAGGVFEGSPSLRVTLPQVLDPGNFLAGGPPLFRMDLSPLARKLEGDDESVTLDFEGGIRRFHRLMRYGFTYEGNVAADEELSFNSIQARLELERNLRPTRYVPLLVTAGAESDQNFDIANAVMTIQGRALLPIDVNFSPRDSGYIPNARPILTLRLEHGWNVRDKTDVAPQDFTRPGYGVRWKVPIARNMVVRLDHDGRWSYGAFFDGAPEYHPMWDAGLEVRQGDVTYFLGYRRGEAPPVFREVKAVMAGLVVGVR